MRGTVRSYDARRGVAEVRTKHRVLEVRWPSIRRSGIVPDPGEEVEVEMTNGVVRRLRRIAVPSKT